MNLDVGTHPREIGEADDRRPLVDLRAVLDLCFGLAVALVGIDHEAVLGGFQRALGELRGEPIELRLLQLQRRPFAVALRLHRIALARQLRDHLRLREPLEDVERNIGGAEVEIGPLHGRLLGVELLRGDVALAEHPLAMLKLVTGRLKPLLRRRHVRLGLPQLLLVDPLGVFLDGDLRRGEILLRLDVGRTGLLEGNLLR